METGNHFNANKEISQSSLKLLNLENIKIDYLKYTFYCFYIYLSSFINSDHI